MSRPYIRAIAVAGLLLIGAIGFMASSEKPKVAVQNGLGSKRSQIAIPEAPVVGASVAVPPSGPMKPKLLHPGATAPSSLPSTPVPGAKTGRPWDDIAGWAAMTPRERLKKLLSGPFAIDDSGAVRTLELAKDELFVPKVQAKLRKIPVQADVEGVLREAEKLAVQTGHMPELVLYPPGVARTKYSRRVLSDGMLVKADDAGAALALARAAGFQDVQLLPAPGFLEVKDQRFPGSALVAAVDFAKQPGISEAMPMLAAQKQAKSVPNDPLFSKQWHLKNTHQVAGVTGIDMNVTGVWDTYKGAGVIIGLIDDGLQYTHPDLSPGYDAAHSYDFLDADANPMPVPVQEPDKPQTSEDETDGDWHGTAVAGVAGARGGNGIGVSGVAPMASLAGIRLTASYTSPAQESNAEGFFKDAIQIKSNSWGPSDFEPWVLGVLPPVVRATLADGAATGRNSKGTIYVWAGGNGREYGDQSNKDGYANCIFVNAVGAVNSSGAQSVYSESGANLVTSAPSDGGYYDPGIVTTDLAGGDGYNPHSDKSPPYHVMPDNNYTSSFGGTSSAAPAVAGTIALMLEANPNLGWRDVKEILLRSGRKLAPTDVDWVSRYGGNSALPPIKHSHKFGGGMVNASAAVNMAKTWTNLAPMTSLTHSSTSTVDIPDYNPAGATVSLDFGSDTPTRVEHVEVTLDVLHTYRGDLDILLVSPGGVTSQLAVSTPKDDGFENGNVPLSSQGYSNWTFSSVRHWGEGSVGTWKVVFRDRVRGDVGSVRSVSVKLYGLQKPVLQTLAFPSNLIVSGAVDIPLTILNGSTKVVITGLPSGLVYNSVTGRITGIPSVPVTDAKIKITATNLAGSDAASTATLNLTIAGLGSNVIGTYYGLVTREPVVTGTFGGAITNLVVGTSGTFTGTLTLASLSYGFGGRLEASASADPEATVSVSRGKLSPIGLHFTIDRSNGHLVNKLPSTVEVEGWRNAYSLTSTATTAGLAGPHNVWFDPPSGDTSVPEGAGIGTASIASNGIVTLKLTLADGSPITRTTIIGSTGVVPVFSSLYANHGSFQGNLVILDHSPFNSVNGALTWNKTGKATATDRSYATGFDIGVANTNSVTARGSEYVKPVSPQILWGLTPKSVGSFNAATVFAGGGIEATSRFGVLAKSFNVSNKHVATIATPNLAVESLSIDPLTGKFTGKFTLSDGSPTVLRTVSYFGITAPGLMRGRGYYILPALPLATGEIKSGAVDFNPVP